MNEHENVLTASESVIMKVIWNANDDIALQNLIEVLNSEHGKNYARTTVVTFLLKLEAKGYVRTYKKGKNSYVHALKSMEGYKDKLLNEMIDFWYGGNVAALQEKLNSVI